MEALSTTEAEYMTFTEAWKKEIWLKVLLTESRYELRLVAGIATGAFVKGGSPFLGSSTSRGCCVSVLTNSDTKPRRVVSPAAVGDGGDDVSCEVFRWCEGDECGGEAAVVGGVMVTRKWRRRPNEGGRGDGDVEDRGDGGVGVAWTGCGGDG
ncbi:hypothetical protein Tco_1356330 [Tanacetum coccineum]